MPPVLSFLRKLLGSDDRLAAFEAEQRRLESAARGPSLDPRFVHEMSVRAGRGGRSALLGTALDDPRVEVRLPMREVAGAGHALVLGATNSGKTYATAGIAGEVLRVAARDPGAMGLAVVDHKGDLVELVRGLVARAVDELPPRLARELVDRVVVIDPFSPRALAPMQILQPERGLDPEVQAYEATTVIGRMGGELGVQQEQFVYLLCLLGVTCGLTLPELHALTFDPLALAGAASRSPDASVRAFFAGDRRLTSTSLSGVQARLQRILRLPSARLSLGARGNVSFHELLASKIVLVDVGSPPAGCEDIGRFWAGLLTLKLVRGIFARSVAEAARPVAVFIDEWAEGLAAGGDIAEHYERVLQLARSRGVSLWLASQSLAVAARVSPSLPRVVATNTRVQMWFTTSPEDARQMDALPVTGRLLRDAPEPWEERSRSPYLSASEEREGLRERLTRLPQRTYLLLNRGRPYPAQFVRSTALTVPRSDEIDRELEARLRDGSLARPIAALQREVEARQPPGAPAGAPRVTPRPEDAPTRPLMVPRGTAPAGPALAGRSRQPRRRS